MSKPTKGTLQIVVRNRDFKDGRESVDLFCRPSPVALSALDWDYVAAKVARDDAALICAAWNACVEINPENPIAAAEAMPEIFRLLKLAVIHAHKITHKTLNPEKWLIEADDAVLKALAKE